MSGLAGEDRANAIVSDNYRRVSERVSQAADRYHREASSIRIIGVTKYVDSQTARLLVKAGCRDLAESRPQELWKKREEIGGEEIRWHMIGHLQRNKVRRTLPEATWIHSVDSLRLLQQIQSDAQSLGLVARILIELNVTPDTSKTGANPIEALSIWEFGKSCDSVRIEGVMGMARIDSDFDTARTDFAAIRRWRDQLRQNDPQATGLTELSMGMSHDFEAAIAEGSTMIRIGSAFFEGLLVAKET